MTAQLPPAESTPTWRLATFIDLFHPKRELLLTAPTQYHAECAADSLMEEGEWFPSFSAVRSDHA